MTKQEKNWLDEIEAALREHYVREGLIQKQLKIAEKCLSEGKEYEFSAGLFKGRYANRQHRIFLRDGHYDLREGWSTSSNKSFV